MKNYDMKQALSIIIKAAKDCTIESFSEKIKKSLDTAQLF
jgi:hypothetical protein